MQASEVTNWDGKGLIGVVHLKPLPGAPRYGGSMAEVCAAAVWIGA